MNEYEPDEVRLGSVMTSAVISALCEKNRVI